VDEHELRFKLDQLTANQERCNMALTRIEVLLAELQFHLPDETVRAAGALFLHERERMAEQFAAVHERLDRLEERLSQQPAAADEPSPPEPDEAPE
jgi:hypothetical protein